MIARLVAGLLLLAAPIVPARAQDALSVMSFNVRLPLASDGPDAWEQRRDLFVATIAREAPDIIGTQELWAIQGNYVVDRLPRYAWFGIDRRGGHADEHMGIFYRRDRLKLIDRGDFWLSDTPSVPGSISWGNLYPRMVSWGRFETLKGRRRFLVYNTHFPYRDEDGPARDKAAAALLARIGPDTGEPVILTGDFNTGPDSNPHAQLTRTLSDAWTGAARRSGPEGSFHGFTGKPGRRIDWILTRGFAVRDIRTVTTHRGARYPSDHFPVVARFDWQAAARN
ncbi:MAG: endonuclease/exonuclease/phosphatase family protein [Pseudomonadota bacterium]